MAKEAFTYDVRCFGGILSNSYFEIRFEVNGKTETPAQFHDFFFALKKKSKQTLLRLTSPKSLFRSISSNKC